MGVIADTFTLPVHLWPTTPPDPPANTNLPGSSPQEADITPVQSGQSTPELLRQPESEGFISDSEDYPGGTESFVPFPPGQQSHSAEAVIATDYFGSLPHFSVTLSHFGSLLSSEEHVIGIVIDLDNTAYYSPGGLDAAINRPALLLQQQEVMSRFNEWLLQLPAIDRRRFLFIINTSRVVTMNPAFSEQRGYLFFPEGQWPQEQLSGLIQPDVLISRNGQEFHYFNSPVFRGRLPELVRRVNSCWPPESSEYTHREKKLITRLLGQNPGFSPKCIQASNQCRHLLVLQELANGCGAFMRQYPGNRPDCPHIHIYDLRINKGTALLHLLNQMLAMELFRGDLHFVTAGDDFADLPMLFPQDFIGTLAREELQATFTDTSLPDRVLACHAGSVISVEASATMNDAIKSIRQTGYYVRATLPGLPGIIQKALEILEARLNIYAL